MPQVTTLIKRRACQLVGKHLHKKKLPLPMDNYFEKNLPYEINKKQQDHSQISESQNNYSTKCSQEGHVYNSLPSEIFCEENDTKFIKISNHTF